MADSLWITGAGIISAIGVGVEATLEAILANRTGIAPVRYLETRHNEFPVGEVKMTNEEMQELSGDSLELPHLRTVLMGKIAIHEAIASASLTGEDISRAAFINGTTVGGMDLTESIFDEVNRLEGQAPHATDMKYNDCGYCTGLISDSIGLPAFATTVSTACSSAANAVIMGANLIKSGLTEIAIAGGAEALTRFHLNGFNTLMILDHDKCRPFDATRAGINLGEGAAYIVIESKESAMWRGVTPIAILSGYGNACDAFHQTATSENGEGAFRSMSEALKMAGLSPSDIDYINAHGTGTPNNDTTELEAMHRVWGEEIPPFSSTKGFTGHTTSASGAIETVISILALRESLIPGNPGWKGNAERNAAPVETTRRNMPIKHILNNSFGFGGNDSTLIISKADSYD